MSRGRAHRRAAVTPQNSGRTAAPAWGTRLRGVLIALDRAGRRRWRYPLAGAAVGAAILLTLAAAGGFPEPNVHDEFSYLLAGDTLASGRLANPPHPLWEFFETIHVISQPSYASKYQPGQALFLALGQAVFGHPYFGVVISNALLFAALGWMLQVWLSPAWGALGTALAVVSLAGGHYFGISYWGGAPAALGGALLLGACRRMERDHRWRYGWLAGAAVVLLFWTRPFEGGLLSLAMAAGAAVWLRQQPRAIRGACLRRAGAPLAAVVLAGLACQFAYNRAVTGSGWVLPYMHASRQYHVVPVLWTSDVAPPKTYRDDALHAQYAVWERLMYTELTGMPAPQRLAYLAQRLLDAVNATVPVALWLPLAFLFLRDRRMRFLLLAALGGGAALCLETWMYPHYIAPWLPLVLLLSFSVLRGLRSVRWRARPAGAYLLAALLAISFGTALARAATEVHYFLHPVRMSVGRERARIAGHLRERGGRHVVVVRYAPEHDVAREWVYNSADIDGAPVVWARDRGARENERLIRYFAGRRFWLFQPEADPPRFEPYPAAGQ